MMRQQAIRHIKAKVNILYMPINPLLHYWTWNWPLAHYITPTPFFAHNLNDEATKQLDIPGHKVIILHIPPLVQPIAPVDEKRQEFSQTRKA